MQNFERPRVPKRERVFYFTTTNDHDKIPGIPGALGGDESMQKIFVPLLRYNSDRFNH